MMTILTIIMMANMMLMINSMNPMKMSVSLMFLSAILLSEIFKMSGQTWFPLILYLIFMGGILIMFMIVSSVMPNQKSGKTKWSLTTILFAITMVSLNSVTQKEPMTLMKSMKWFMETLPNLSTTIILMILYFFTFLMILGMEKYPLRSFSC